MRVPVIFISLMAIVSFAGCGDDRSNFGAKPGLTARETQLTPEKRKNYLANNALFVAVFNNDLPEARALLEKHREWINVENTDHDDPLDVAINEGLKGMALELAKHPALKPYHQNKDGNGHVYLAARMGMNEVIHALAEREYTFPPYWPNSQGWIPGYSFSRIDMPNKNNERALFVAANRDVVEELSAQYWREPVSNPVFSFTRQADAHARNFLHQAAFNGNVDVLLWANENLCQDFGWEKSNWKIFSAIGSTATFLYRRADTYLIHPLPWIDPNLLLFNAIDDKGESPLMTAIANQKWEAMRAIESCGWVDYEYQDEHGDNALHLFLSKLNAYIPDQGAELHDAFAGLLSQMTITKGWYRNPVTRMSAPNQEGNEPIHLAAALADPYFYTLMRARGAHVYDTDQQLRTAASIFQQRQSGARIYAH